MTRAAEGPAGAAAADRFSQVLGHRHRAMRGASLAGVFVLAKILSVAGRHLPGSLWLPSALFWDDVAIGVGVWLCDRWLGRPRVMWVVYWLAVCWAALNVPIARALSSPLTRSMLRASGGPLLDSIGHELTPANAACIAAVLLASAVAPRLLTRIPGRRRTWLAVAAIAMVLPGPLVSPVLDLNGHQRNAITTLGATWLPRMRGRAASGDWRASPFGRRDANGARHAPSASAVSQGQPIVEAALSKLRGAAAGRNVLIIVLESTAARYLHAYGAVDDPTPRLTTLAASALQFERAYAVYPESIKGLFAMLCSRDPAFDLPAEVHASLPCVPLARALSDAGYRTALFHSGRFAYLGMSDVLSRQGFDTLEDAGAIGGKVQSSFGVDEPSTVQRILGWIDARESGRPFFGMYLPVAGHHPYATAAPGPFAGRGDFSAYQNALHEGDESIGALIDGLRDRGLDRDTMVVVYGDHGEAFGQHDGNAGHTLEIYDENVRVPLMVAIPGVTPGRLVDERVASVIDIAPTVLDLLGLPVPARYEGTSLLGAGERMALFYTDYSVGLLGLQDRCWKYQIDIDAGRSRLFDTCVDPDEMIDRAGDEPDRVRAYRDRVEAWAGARRAAALAAR